MANQLYGYNPSSYSGGGGESADRRSVYSSRSNADSSLRGSSKYLDSDNYAASSRSSYYSSSMLFNHTDSAAGGYSGMSTRIPGVSVTTSQLASWPGPPGVDAGAAASSSSVDPLLASLKRHSYEALYHQNLLGAHSTIGQSESWLSTNPLAKRPRFDHASNLPIYPQRPGEKDCAHYMLTRTCKFGDSCIFDHPIWVPEGGIPDWKEVPLYATHDSLPERPGLPDCPYFLKTQRCKYGPRCKFNHPRDAILPLSALEDSNVSSLPERPSEPPCVFYMKTGKCKFGATCKFHHPKDIQAPLAEQENGSILQALAVSSERVQPLVTPALLHNSKGLPIRPGEVDCPFYLKTGSCKYSVTCRYNHPDRIAIYPTAAALGASIASPASHLNIGIVNPAASVLQTIDPRLTQTTLGLAPTVYPQRPGTIECDHYMKTGECKFGERCKYHHPIDRSVASLSTKETQEDNVKLSLAGLPRREGAIHCPYYMKTGTCKFGATCKFDHPPPGEVMAVSVLQGPSTSVGGEGTENGD